jgi:hypothetical protein
MFWKTQIRISLANLLSQQINTFQNCINLYWYILKQIFSIIPLKFEVSSTWFASFNSPALIYFFVSIVIYFESFPKTLTYPNLQPFCDFISDTNQKGFSCTQSSTNLTSRHRKENRCCHLAQCTYGRFLFSTDLSFWSTSIQTARF